MRMVVRSLILLLSLSSAYGHNKNGHKTAHELVAEATLLENNFAALEEATMVKCKEYDVVKDGKCDPLDGTAEVECDKDKLGVCLLACCEIPCTTIVNLFEKQCQPNDDYLEMSCDGRDMSTCAKCCTSFQETAIVQKEISVSTETKQGLAGGDFVDLEQMSTPLNVSLAPRTKKGSRLNKASRFTNKKLKPAHRRDLEEEPGSSQEATTTTTTPPTTFRRHALDPNMLLNAQQDLQQTEVNDGDFRKLWRFAPWFGKEESTIYGQGIWNEPTSEDDFKIWLKGFLTKNAGRGGKYTMKNFPCLYGDTEENTKWTQKADFFCKDCNLEIFCDDGAFVIYIAKGIKSAAFHITYEDMDLHIDFISTEDYDDLDSMAKIASFAKQARDFFVANEIGAIATNEDAAAITCNNQAGKGIPFPLSMTTLIKYGKLFYEKNGGFVEITQLGFDQLNQVKDAFEVREVASVETAYLTLPLTKEEVKQMRDEECESRKKFYCCARKAGGTLKDLWSVSEASEVDEFYDKLILRFKELKGNCKTLADKTEPAPTLAELLTQRVGGSTSKQCFILAQDTGEGCEAVVGLMTELDKNVPDDCGDARKVEMVKNIYHSDIILEFDDDELSDGELEHMQRGRPLSKELPVSKPRPVLDKDLLATLQHDSDGEMDDSDTDSSIPSEPIKQEQVQEVSTDHDDTDTDSSIAASVIVEEVRQETLVWEDGESIGQNDVRCPPLTEDDCE